MNHVSESLAREGYVRPQDGRVLGGVCAGLGGKLGLSAWKTRILFVLVLMVIPGSQILVYPILWILMPEAGPESNPSVWTNGASFPTADQR